MDLIDRYLQSVKQAMFLMPAAQRRDILNELGESLRSDVEAKEEEVERPLTDEEREAILKRYGHPLLVAGRYRGEHRSVAFGRQLIGPELFPLYRAILTLNVSLTAVVVTVISLFVPHVAVGSFFVPLIMQFAIITSIFIAADLSVRRSVSFGWSPRALPAPRDPLRISRASSIFEIAALLLILGIWIDFPYDLGWNAGSTWADFRAAYYMPFIVLVLAMLATSFANLVRPRWTRARLGLRIVTNVAGAAMLSSKVFTHLGEATAQYHLLSAHAAKTKAAAFEAIMNCGVTWSLAVGAAAILLQVLYDLVRLARIEN